MPAGCTANRSIPWPGQALMDPKVHAATEEAHAGGSDPAMPALIMLCKIALTKSRELLQHTMQRHCRVSHCLAAFCCTLLTAVCTHAASGFACLLAGWQRRAQIGCTTANRA